MDFKKLANLDEMKMMSRGNPGKLADYVILRSELDQVKSSHFNEEYPFVNSFDEGHLESLKQFAEENPEDESAQVRYALQKERFAVNEGKKTAHIDHRVAKSELRNKLVSGEKMTPSDLKTAEKIARQVATAENLSVYSQIKNLINEGADE